MAPPKLDLTGQRFGQLFVLRLEACIPKYGTRWLCRCDCGSDYSVRGSHLKSGNTVKCIDCAFRARRNPGAVGEMSIHYWNQILRGAAQRSLSVELTKEEAYQKFIDQQGKCALSGEPINFPPRSNRPKLGNASLDRIDSRKGYTVKNIQWVHKDVNKMKMEFAQERFIELCEKVAYASASATKGRADPPA